jgi:hypothetical protein
MLHGPHDVEGLLHARCSLSPHIALREAGLAFDLVKVDLAAKKVDDGSDYSTSSPPSCTRASGRSTLGLSEGNAGFEGIAVKVRLQSNATPDAIAELHRKVVRTSPVGHTLARAVPVQIDLA